MTAASAQFGQEIGLDLMGLAFIFFPLPVGIIDLGIKHRFFTSSYAFVLGIKVFRKFAFSMLCIK